MVRQKGSGSVVTIKGKHYARWTVDGRRVYGEPRDHYDEADADRLEHKPQDSQSPLSASSVPTLQEWAHQCQEGRYGQSKAESTYEFNETARTLYIEGSKIGKKRLHRITAEDIEQHLYEIKVTRSKKVDGKLVKWKDDPSPAYVRRIAAFESKLFSLAIKAKLLKANPMRGVDLPEIPERENRTLSPEEAMVLLNPRTRTDAVMLVAMHTGMERKALIRLQWSHVGENTVSVPGTKNKYRKAVIPLTPEARAAILSQPRRSVFVFTTESGLPLSPRNLTRDVSLRKAQLGIPKETRLQDLRGSYVSLLIEQGEDIRTVMELARHNDAKTTLKAYARSRPEVLAGAVERLRGSITPKVVDASRMEKESG